MKITMRDQYAYIEEFHYIPEVVRNIMTYQTLGKNGERILANLYDSQNHRFPAGAWPTVRTTLKNTSTFFNFQDETQYPSKKNCLDIGVHLRSYQKEAEAAFLQGNNEQGIKGRGILQIATGGGKTIVAAKLAAEINDFTLFFVHTKDLMTQTYDTFKSLFGIEKVGRAGGGLNDYYSASGELKQIVICMVQSFYAQGKNEFELKPEYRSLLDACKFVIFDECHHSSSDSWFYVAMECRAPFRLGLSATPFRSDGKNILLEAATGPVIYKISSEELIEMGYLSRPTIKMFPVEVTLAEDFAENNNWHNLYKGAIAFNPHRNSMIATMVGDRLADNKSVLIIVNFKIHGQILQQMINRVILAYKGAGKIDPKDSSKVSMSISSDFDLDTRDAAIKMFKEGHLGCLIVTQLGDEGLDIPSVQSVFMVGGMKSEIKVIQRLGRSLRLGTRCNYMNPDKTCSLFSTNGEKVRCIELEKKTDDFDDVKKITTHGVKIGRRIIDEYLGNVIQVGKDKFERQNNRMISSVTASEIYRLWEFINTDGIIVDPIINEISGLPSRIRDLFRKCESRLSFKKVGAEEVKLFKLMAILAGIDETVSVKCQDKILKTKVEYVDFFDICDVNLEKHSWDRLAVYEEEGHNPQEGLLEEIADPFNKDHIVWQTEGCTISLTELAQKHPEHFNTDNI